MCLLFCVPRFTAKGPVFASAWQGPQCPFWAQPWSSTVSLAGYKAWSLPRRRMECSRRVLLEGRERAAGLWLLRRSTHACERVYDLSWGCVVKTIVSHTQSKNKESLRNMSMVLRQMGKGTCNLIAYLSSASDHSLLHARCYRARE